MDFIFIWIFISIIWILRSAFQFTQRNQLGFLKGLHWICTSVWRVYWHYADANMIEPNVPKLWDKHHCLLWLPVWATTSKNLDGEKTTPFCLWDWGPGLELQVGGNWSCACLLIGGNLASPICLSEFMCNGIDSQLLSVLLCLPWGFSL